MLRASRVRQGVRLLGAAVAAGALTVGLLASPAAAVNGVRKTASFGGVSDVFALSGGSGLAGSGQHVNGVGFHSYWEHISPNVNGVRWSSGYILGRQVNGVSITDTDLTSVSTYRGVNGV
jgi:hypothetical protein